MPTYHVEFIARNGEHKRGKIEAEDIDEARVRLEVTGATSIIVAPLLPPSPPIHLPPTMNSPTTVDPTRQET